MDLCWSGCFVEQPIPTGAFLLPSRLLHVTLIRHIRALGRCDLAIAVVSDCPYLIPLLLSPYPPPVMEYFYNRFESFAPTKSKRTKAASGKRSTWPHPASFKATPETLAEAGFYFYPDSESEDNVACFMCKKNLGGWEPDDDPFTIHYDRCGNDCAWAIVRCQRALDKRHAFSRN